jgi:ring-1,2-phenylacetyl-CoA epoxidase subunit PaaD
MVTEMVTQTGAQRAVESVTDPELPMLTLADLGVVRSVVEHADSVTVTITPTYSGCPALAEMRADLHRALTEAGYRRIEVRTTLSPPWSTDWITDAGRRKLTEAGIAPPAPTPRESGFPPGRVGDFSTPRQPVPLNLDPPPAHDEVPCPRCGTPHTEQLSRFGPTACTALRRCPSCQEPFEHLRPL